MPRPRLNQQNSYHHQSHSHAIPQAHNAVPFMQGMQPQAHSHSSMQSLPQRSADLHVQRSQGVIILSKNQPHQTAPPPTSIPPSSSVSAAAVSALSMPSLGLASHVQQNQMQHQIPPAHNSAMSMFNPQLQYFMPSATQLMQNALYPFYQNPNTTQASSIVTPQHQQILNQVVSQHQNQNQNQYATNNGNNSSGSGSGNMGLQTINYDDYMQAPPSPIKPKSKRRTRRNQMDSSDDSSEEEQGDSDDPEWTVGDDEPEANYINQGRSPRGRRTSSGRGRGRGGGNRGGGRGSRGGGGGRGGRGGRGGARGGGQGPPTLVDQTQTVHTPQGGGRGRQTRGSSMNMPSLDPQAQMSFGELVSQAVQSLADPDAGMAESSHQQRRKQKSQAILERMPNGRISVTRVPVAPNTKIVLFAPVIYSKQGRYPEADELEVEDEDLIMAYEIQQEEDKQKPFMCEKCGKETRSRVLHNRHLVTHEPTLRFPCCICSALFSDYEKLKPHLRTHHGSGIFICPDLDCEGVFQERKSLDDHEFACHPDARRFICKYCLDRFSSEAEQHAHENAHGEDIDANCPKCQENFKAKSEFDEHMTDMHEEKECQYCKEKFPNKPSLDDHQHEKHLELIKPPTPPAPSPPPSPPAPDSDPDYNPQADLGSDDEIVVVGECKRSSRSRVKPKSKDKEKSQPKPGPSFAIAGPSSSSKPGPKSSKKEEMTPKSILKTPTAVRKSGLAGPYRPGSSSKPPVKFTDDVVITLSSDSEEEKDKTWKPPGRGSTGRGRGRPPSSSRPSRSKNNEYVIVVETPEDEDASSSSKKKTKSQSLTFQMGDDGELKLLNAPGTGITDSLPMKEIMDIIKTKKLTDNSTIILEDNKVSSIQPGSVQNQKPRIGPASKTKVPPSSSKPGPASLKRPQPPSVSSGPAILRKDPKKSRPSSSGGEVITLDLDDDDSNSSKPKPKTSLVAKKRTGGLPPSSKPSTSSSSSSSKPPGAIAKKRTGGSSSHYESQKSSHLSDRDRHPRKSQQIPSTHMDDDPLADDDDYPVIIEETYVESVEPLKPLKKPPPPTLASSQSSGASSGSKRGPRGPYKKKGKKGKKHKLSSKSKSKGREERQDRLQKKQMEDGVILPGGVGGEFEEAPKRSLRIALKASVTDTNYDESIENGDGYQPSSLPPPVAHPPPEKKRKSSTTPSASSSSTAGPSTDGQVVMKAFVDGVWQDVVIGTKLSDDAQAHPTPPQNLPPPPPPVNIPPPPRGGRRKTSANANPSIPIPLPPSPTKFPPSARGGKRTKGGKKGKNAVVADPWKDDRYQYFSAGRGGGGSSSSRGGGYRVPDQSYGVGGDVDYTLGQDFAASDDAVMPFSLSSYMTYHHADQEPSPEQVPAEVEPEDQDIPVILNAYHVNAEDAFQPHQKFKTNPLDDYDEIPMEDPLAMDDSPPCDPIEAEEQVPLEEDRDPLDKQDSPENPPEESRRESPVPSPKPSAIVKPKKTGLVAKKRTGGAPPSMAQSRPRTPTPPPPDSPEKDEEESEEEEEEESTPYRPPPPPPSAAVKKGTQLDAAGALAGLRTVLSMFGKK